MLKSIVEILIMFVLTIGLMRLMGKSSIVQLTPYDLVAIFIVGTVVTEPLSTPEFIPGVISAVVIVIFYKIFAHLSLNQAVNNFLLGKPTILIKHGKIVEDNLEQEQISLSQLLSILRTAGYSKLTEISFAILEPTGNVSVIPVSSASPVTLEDLDIEGNYEGMPMALIIDGTIQKNNLQLVNKSEDWLLQQVKAKGVNNIDDVIYAFVDDQTHELFLNVRGEEKKAADNTTEDNNQMQQKKKPKDEDSDKLTKEKKIYLVRNHKLQLDGLEQLDMSRSELLKLLEVDNFKEIKEIVLKQELLIKQKNNKKIGISKKIFEKLSF